MNVCKEKGENMADKKKASPKLIYESKASLYEKAVSAMNADSLIVQHAFKIENYLDTAEMFDQLEDYKDAAELAQKCRELAEKTKKDKVEYRYQLAVDQKNMAESGKDYEKAEKMFREVADYKDAEALMKECSVCREQLQKKAKMKRRIKLVLLLLCVVAVLGFIQSPAWKKVQRKMIKWNQKMTETAAPETETPETALPETEVPETAVPETKAPETEASETLVPETESE